METAGLARNITSVSTTVSSIQCTLTFDEKLKECVCNYLLLTRAICPLFPQIDIIRAMMIVWGKKKNYQVYSLQLCVQQLCTVQCTHAAENLCSGGVA